MKHRNWVIALATAAICFFSLPALAAWLPSDIHPADQYSDPADYELILMDRDGWELRMNQVEDTTYTIKFSGILFYGYGSSKYVGELNGIYYKTDDLLLVQCTDPGWNNSTMSYGLHGRYDWRMIGVYNYFETGASDSIYADIVKGQLGDHVPYGE